MDSRSFSDTSPTPVTHRTAARMLYPSGRSRTTAQVRKGTMTQYTAVRNAFFEGVVRARPKVWRLYARNSIPPMTAPRHR